MEVKFPVGSQYTCNGVRRIIKYLPTGLPEPGY